jgi:ribosomal protein L7/L12
MDLDSKLEYKKIKIFYIWKKFWAKKVTVIKNVKSILELNMPAVKHYKDLP